MHYALLLKTLSILVGIVALIYLCFYLYKKRAGFFVAAQSRINIVEKRSLDQRTTISLVRIDDREMIIVSHQNGVNVHGMPESIASRSFKDFVSTKTAVQ